MICKIKDEWNELLYVTLRFKRPLRKVSVQSLTYCQVVVNIFLIDLFKKSCVTFIRTLKRYPRFPYLNIKRIFKHKKKTHVTHHVSLFVTLLLYFERRFRKINLILLSLPLIRLLINNIYVLVRIPGRLEHLCYTYIITYLVRLVNIFFTNYATFLQFFK